MTMHGTTNRAADAQKVKQLLNHVFLADPMEIGGKANAALWCAVSSASSAGCSTSPTDVLIRVGAPSAYATNRRRRRNPTPERR